MIWIILFILFLASVSAWLQIRWKIKLWNHKYIMRMLDHMYDLDDARRFAKEYPWRYKLKTNGADEAQKDHECFF